VRWRPDVIEAQRVDLERHFGLTDGHQTKGTTWAYTLADASSSNIRAIVQDEWVADTAYINRIRFRPAFAYDRPRRVVVFAVAIGAVGSMLVAVRSVLLPASRMSVVLARPALLTAAAAPPAILAGAAAVMLVMALLGYQPLWGGGEVTLVQAAVSRDLVRVARMIEQGSDPNAAAQVQIDDRSVVLTPLEAAVVSRDLATVTLLVDLGARFEGAAGARLACLADDGRADDIVEYLQNRGIQSPSSETCQGIDDRRP
jgi:hypothetical protein